MDDLGRPLDAALARQLFGFETEARVNTRTRQQDYVSREHGAQWTQTAFYSAGSASLSVHERLYRLGWKIHDPASDRRKDAAGLYHVALNGPNGRRVVASGETWEVALARAALRAVA